MAWFAPRTWTTGELVTAAMANEQWRDNSKEVWRELAYTAFTSNVSVTSTSPTSPTAVVDSGSVVLGDALVLVEFFSPWVEPGASAGATVIIQLWEDGTLIGRFGQVVSPAATSSGAAQHLVYRLPTGGGTRSATLLVQAFRTVANGTIYGGAGGADAARVPGFIRVSKKGA